MTACGCRIVQTKTPANYADWDFEALGAIVFCPLHASAEQMREALKDLLPFAERYCSQNGLTAKRQLHLAYSCLAASEGKEESHV